MVAKRDLSVRVVKKEAVTAALPMQHHWLPQSNLDLLLPPLSFGVFFCYQKPKFTLGSVSGVLKAALAEALVSYYALAGEVVQNAGGEPELLCNNRGVDFAEAVADVELSELNLYNPDESVEGKLVPGKKHGGVLAVQLRCCLNQTHQIHRPYSLVPYHIALGSAALATALPSRRYSPVAGTSLPRLSRFSLTVRLRSPRITLVRRSPPSAVRASQTDED